MLSEFAHMYWFGGVVRSVSQGGENMTEITTAHKQYVQMVCMLVEFISVLPNN